MPSRHRTLSWFCRKNAVEDLHISAPLSNFFVFRIGLAERSQKCLKFPSTSVLCIEDHLLQERALSGPPHHHVTTTTKTAGCALFWILFSSHLIGQLLAKRHAVACLKRILTSARCLMMQLVPFLHPHNLWRNVDAYRMQMMSTLEWRFSLALDYTSECLFLLCTHLTV